MCHRYRSSHDASLYSRSRNFRGDKLEGCIVCSDDVFSLESVEWNGWSQAVAYVGVSSLSIGRPRSSSCRGRAVAWPVRAVYRARRVYGCMAERRLARRRRAVLFSRYSGYGQTADTAAAVWRASPPVGSWLLVVGCRLPVASCQGRCVFVSRTYLLALLLSLPLLVLHLQLEVSLLTLCDWSLFCLQIIESDGLPTQICTKCVCNVNNWHTFKKVCNDAQTKLRDWVNSESSSAQVRIYMCLLSKLIVLCLHAYLSKICHFTKMFFVTCILFVCHHFVRYLFLTQINEIRNFYWKYLWI